MTNTDGGTLLFRVNRDVFAGDRDKLFSDIVSSQNTTRFTRQRARRCRRRGGRTYIASETASHLTALMVAADIYRVEQLVFHYIEP